MTQPSPHRRFARLPLAGALAAALLLAGCGASEDDPLARKVAAAEAAANRAVRAAEAAERAAAASGAKITPTDFGADEETANDDSAPDAFSGEAETEAESPAAPQAGAEVAAPVDETGIGTPQPARPNRPDEPGG